MSVRVTICLALLALVPLAPTRGSDPTIALLHCSHDPELLPNDYESSHLAALRTIRSLGFPCDRVESRDLADGALARKAYKLLVISYTGVMSAAEAQAVRAFVEAGGKLLNIYSSCAHDPSAGKATARKCSLEDVIAGEYVGNRGGGVSRCTYIEATDGTHPIFRRLPDLIYNPHHYSLIMKPKPGAKVLARWINADQVKPTFKEPNNAAILESASALHFAGYLWHFPSRRAILRNMIDYLLGNEVATAQEARWPRPAATKPVKSGINLRHSDAPALRVDAIAWPSPQPINGLSTCAVVYPHRSSTGREEASRIANVLGAPLMSDFEATQRDKPYGWGAVCDDYRVIAVTGVRGRRGDNMLCNMLPGLWPEVEHLPDRSSAGVVRVAPAGVAGKQPMLLVAGSDDAGLRRAADTVLAGVALARGAPLVTVWQPANPFGDLVYPYVLPREPTDKLTITASVNERAKTQFVITPSIGMQKASARITVGPLRSPAGDALPPETVEVLATRYIKTQTTHRREPDPLEPFETVQLVSGQNQQVWVIIDLTQAKPGEYRSTLAIDISGASLSRHLPLSVHVLPITLAERNRIPLATGVWDYRAAGYIHGHAKRRKPWRDQAVIEKWEAHYQEHFKAHWRAYCDGLAAHGVNVMFFPPNCVLPQYQPNDQIVDEQVLTDFITYGRPRGFRTFIFTQILGQSSAAPNTHEIDDAKSEMFSPAWNAAYQRILRGYIDFTQRLGLRFEDWAVYPYDEPHTEHAVKVVTGVAQLIDEVDSRIQLWCDPSKPRRPARTLDYWQRMAPSIDIWCPHDHFVKPGTATYDFVRKLKEPVWFYRCGGYLHKGRPSRRPEPYFRAFPWQAVHRKLAGFGFWTYMAWLGDSWNDCDVTSRSGDGGVVYEGKAGPVTSINWEAWSEGIDDLKYLLALQAQIDRLRPVAAARSREAEALLHDAVATVAASPSEAGNQRARVRDEIMALQALR